MVSMPRASTLTTSRSNKLTVTLPLRRESFGRLKTPPLTRGWGFFSAVTIRRLTHLREQVPLRAGPSDRIGAPQREWQPGPGWASVLRKIRGDERDPLQRCCPAGRAGLIPTRCAWQVQRSTSGVRFKPVHGDGPKSAAQCSHERHEDPVQPGRAQARSAGAAACRRRPDLC